MNFKYKELIPDETIDIFYDKIERPFSISRQWLLSSFKVISYL